MADHPLLTADPKAGFTAHAAEIRAAIERVLTAGQYILGPEVDAFEREFAEYHLGGKVLGVANGTDALELALRAVGVGRGDFVATVANTVSATISAIEQIGARPVFVDIDRDTMVMSTRELERLAKHEAGKIKAVLPVHLYGHPADLPEITRIARECGARVVEDCAQSHGATIDGRKAGRWGDAAAYSFYPTKNLGALGDGGAVYTRDSEIAERVHLLRQYGWRQRYVSDLPGRNSRLDELQAAILRVKLRYLDADNATRAALAQRYLANLADAALTLPTVRAGAASAWHQFTIRTPHRDRVRDALAKKQIMCGVLYPVPIHRQPAYAVSDLSLPETERACAEVLCLPIHPAITPADVDRVCDEILRSIRP